MGIGATMESLVSGGGGNDVLWRRGKLMLISETRKLGSFRSRSVTEHRHYKLGSSESLAYYLTRFIFLGDSYLPSSGRKPDR